MPGGRDSFLSEAGGALFQEIELPLSETALDLMRWLGGPDCSGWVPRARSGDCPLPPGLAVCSPGPDGLARWRSALDDPGNAHPGASELASDEEHEGGYYLCLPDPPVALAVLGTDGEPVRLVGFMCGVVAWIDPCFRGSGGGRALLVAACEDRGGEPLRGMGGNVSAAGLASLRSALRIMRARASAAYSAPAGPSAGKAPFPRDADAADPAPDGATEPSAVPLSR